MNKLIGLSLVLLSSGLQAATISSSKNVELLVIDGKKKYSHLFGHQLKK